MEHADSTELAAIPLLRALQPAQVEQLRDHSRLRRLDEHERLFDHGQPAAQFYWLRSGLLKLIRLSPEGMEKVIKIVTPGETFAEAVIFSGQGSATYPVTCEALEASEVVAIDGATMVALLRESPDTSLRMLAHLSQRLREQVQEIENLTLHNATTRLLGYLVRLATGVTREVPVVRLSMPKHVLASRLNIQPETLSRILAKLSRESLIEVRGHEVLLHDLDRLERMNDI